MSNLSSPDFAESISALQRGDSGETDESAFGSNLVTPTDEDSHLNEGIHERFDAATKILGYFASEDVCDEVKESHQAETTVLDVAPESLEHLTALVDDELGDIAEPDMNTSLLTTFDSAETIPSPVLSSSEHLDTARRPRVGSIYMLPNDHITIERSSSNSNINAEEECNKQDTELLKDSVADFEDLGLKKSWAQDLAPLISNLTLRAFVSLAIRLLCFLPWCIAVGGALVFFPDYVQQVAFDLGYIDSMTGIRRFSHWAEYGLQHITTSLAFLAVVTYLFPTGGFVLVGGLLAQFCWEWHAFLLDRTIPLGDDDRQTVYLLATTTWLTGNSLDIMKHGERYYSTACSVPAEDVADLKRIAELTNLDSE